LFIAGEDAGRLVQKPPLISARSPAAWRAVAAGGNGCARYAQSYAPETSNVLTPR